MKNPFQAIFKGKVVIVGIGNPLRGDDGLGVELIRSLKEKLKAICIEAGISLERYAGKIIKEKPEAILLIDAVHLSCVPGKYEILKKEGILNSGFSTHDLSPKMFIEYLEKNTSADIYLLGVQPKSVSFGEGLSPQVEVTLKELERLIHEAENA